MVGNKTTAIVEEASVVSRDGHPAAPPAPVNDLPMVDREVTQNPTSTSTPDSAVHDVVAAEPVNCSNKQPSVKQRGSASQQ